MSQCFNQSGLGQAQVTITLQCSLLYSSVAHGLPHTLWNALVRTDSICDSSLTTALTVDDNEYSSLEDCDRPNKQEWSIQLTLLQLNGDHAFINHTAVQLVFSTLLALNNSSDCFISRYHVTLRNPFDRISEFWNLHNIALQNRCIGKLNIFLNFEFCDPIQFCQV